VENNTIAEQKPNYILSKYMLDNPIFKSKSQFKMTGRGYIYI